MTSQPREEAHTPLWRALWKPAGLSFVLIAVLELGVGRSDVLESLPKETRAALYNALASSGASLLGFVLTAAALYLTTTANSRFEFLRQRRLYNEGADNFYRTIGMLGVATLFALACMVWDVGTNARIWMVYAMLTLVVVSCWVTCKCVVFMRNITRLAGVPSNVS